MEKALKLAIRGGWKPTWYFNHFNDDEAVFGDINKDDENNPCYYLNIYKIFSSPLFWQCLGKSLDWGGYQCLNCGYKHFSLIGFSECCPKWQTSKARLEWEYHWHSFIDHLATGGNPEEFFNNLLADK